MATQTLLLGAGFSKNFGLPLAKDILLEMFNRIKTPHIKTEILQEINRKNDFEAYYSEKVKNGTIDNDSREILEALLAVYKSMDEQVLRSFSIETFSYLKVIAFINKFSAHAGGCGYVFTLNQDLLLERLYSDYLKNKNFYRPGGWNGECIGALLPYYGPVNSPFYKFHKDDMRDKNENVDVDDVDQEKIDAWKQQYSDTYEQKTRKIPCLVKLHGTYYWSKKDRQARIWGIGKNKLEQIRKEPLLYLQYEKFKEILIEGSVNVIYIIGYSFCDDHINDILYTACEKGSFLIVVDALPIEKFLIRVNDAFKRIEKTFDHRWLAKYLYTNFNDFFSFDGVPSGLFVGSHDENLSTINKLTCSLYDDPWRTLG